MRTKLSDTLSAFDPSVITLGCHRTALGAEKRRHQGQPIVRSQRQVMADDGGLNLTVERNRGDGVLDA